MALLSSLMIRIGADPDGVKRGVRQANRELDRLRANTVRVSRDMGREGDQGGNLFSRGWVKGIDAVKKAVTDGAKLMLKASGTIAAVGSAAITAFPLVLKLASGLATAGQVAIAAAPALIAAGAGAFILKTAFAQLFADGTAARKALEPLAGVLTKARDAGSQAAAKGVRPLAEALARVARPELTRFMVGLGQAANRVQKDFLRWAKSTDGLRTLRGILEPLSKMVNDLAPHVSRLAIAFTRMLGRVMPVSTALGSRGLAGALDWLSKKLDSVQADQVSGALGKIGKAARTVINVVRLVAGWIGKLVTAYRTYTKQFGLVADALSVVAIIFGGPVATIVAGASLIIRHFGQLKSAWTKLTSAFKSGQGPASLQKAFGDIKAAIAIVRPEFTKMMNDIKAKALPALKQLGGFIINDLIPTLAEFVRAVAPVIAWLLRVWGPVAANAVKNLIDMIRGALMIVSGIIKIFTAILTGDWHKAWEGVKQILSGAVVIVKAWIRQLIAFLTGTFKAFTGQADAIWSRTGGAVIRRALAMVNGVVSRIRSGISRARSAASSVASAIKGVFSSAGSWLVGAGRAIINGLTSGIRSAIGGLRSLLNKVTSWIPDWKGPMSVDMKLLQPTGQAIMGGLVNGVRRSVPTVRKAFQNVTADIPSYAAPPGVAATAQRSNPQEIVIKSGGSRLDDALVEVLRKAIADKGGNVQKVLGR